MKILVCINCRREMPMCLDVSSKAGLICVYCNAKQLARRDRHGKLKIEEAELGADIVIDRTKIKTQPT